MNESIKFDAKKEFIPLIAAIKTITLQFESHKDLTTALIRAQCWVFECT